MNKPTIEEYNKAKEEYNTYCSWCARARERKNKLLDELIVERNNEKLYFDLAEKQREIICTYEIYEETEKQIIVQENKTCGNCAFAKSTTWGNKVNERYVECTNKEHVDKYCKGVKNYD